MIPNYNVESSLFKLTDILEIGHMLNTIKSTPLYEEIINSGDFINCNIPSEKECNDADIRMITIINVVTKMVIGSIDKCIVSYNCTDNHLQKYIDFCNIFIDLDFKTIVNILLRIMVKYDNLNKLNTKLVALHIISNIQPKMYIIRNNDLLTQIKQ